MNEFISGLIAAVGTAVIGLGAAYFGLFILGTISFTLFKERTPKK